MWRILFGQGMFCFYSAGMCWFAQDPRLLAIGFSFAALGVISAAAAAHLRLSQFGGWQTSVSERWGGSSLLHRLHARIALRPTEATSITHIPAE